MDDDQQARREAAADTLAAILEEWRDECGAWERETLERAIEYLRRRPGAGVEAPPPSRAEE